MSRDPLIVGPDAAALAAQGAPAESPHEDFIDLRATHPLQDLWLLLRQPQRFFAFFGEVERLSDWVCFKAFFGLLFVSWLAGFTSSGRVLGRIYAKASDLLDTLPLERLRPFLRIDTDVDSIRHWLLVGLVSLGHVRTILQPLFVIIFVLLVAASSSLVLASLEMGHRRVSFRAVFFALLFAHWYGLVALVPVAGPLLALMLLPLMSVLALKWVYRIAFAEALFSIAFPFLIFGVLVTAAFVSVLTVVARVAL